MKSISHNTRSINLGFIVVITLQNDERTLPIEKSGVLIFLKPVICSVRLIDYTKIIMDTEGE